jgi:Lar family restriction alleviation protein
MELKECPFCGGKAEIQEDVYGNADIVCKKCGIATTLSNDKNDAIERWNRRVK